jgi:hypothetical protein
MVCIRLACHEILPALLTISTAVFIPSSNPLTRWIGHRQCAPVTIPQTELTRRPERDDTDKFAYKVIHSRHAAQNGLLVARKGLAICP